MGDITRYTNRYGLLLCFIAFCSLLTAGCRGAAQRQLSSAVEDYNRTCPMRMSDMVRIDSLHYDRGAGNVVFCCTVLALSQMVLYDDDDFFTVRNYCENQSRTQLQRMQSNEYGRETLMLLNRAKASLSFVYRLECGDTVMVYNSVQ